MSDNSNNSKRIAINTIMLYFRMFLTMGVALFTSRVILQSLGIQDYGIYNVVAGFVSMFTFINSAMTSATQRYVTFAIGKNESNRINTVFCTSMNIHILISVLLVLVAETFGLWFLNTHMTIPTGRLFAANIVYQCAILSTVVMIVSTPYNALIVAHEKMSAFAYISILDVSVKLLIAYLLHISSYDRLIVYAILMFGAQFLIRQIYSIYCHKHFPESKFRIVKDMPLFKEMISFSGWNLFGNLASVGSGQGINVILNMFFGPVVNAARGVAIQVQNAVLGFSSNFQMAINPQITKNYATGNLSYMHTLIYASSKYSFYLLFILSLPIVLEADNILSVWLGTVPEHTSNFLRLALITSIVNAMAGPLTIAAQAYGKIKRYQSVVGGILLLSFPVAYVCLKLGGSPEMVYIVDLVVVCTAQIVRIYMMRNMIKLSIREYLKEVILRVCLVAIAGGMVPIIAYVYLKDNTFLSFMSVCLVSVLSVVVSVYFIGIKRGEREKVKAFIKSKIKKNKEE